MRGGNSCSAETFTTRRVGLRRSGVPAAILPNHSATGSRLGVAPDNSTAPVRRSGIGNCWASCESAVVADNGNPAKIDYDDQLQLGFEDLTADTLKSERSISPIMRNPPLATGFQTRISASLSTMMTGSPSGNCPGDPTASASGVFEPPSSGIEMRAGVSAASQIHTAIARTGRATGTPARPTTAMRKSANCYCSNLGPTGYE